MRRKIFATIITLIMVLSFIVLPNSVFFVPDVAHALSGFGNATSPFMIYNAVDLQAVGDNLTAYYRLMNNIDASATKTWNGGAGFIPIGNTTTPFTGNFNGGNFTISGLHIYRPTTDNIGLFGQTANATIADVVISSSNITGRWNVGSLVGWATATNVTNCDAMWGYVTAGSAGGLIGYLETWGTNQTSVIQDCHTTLDVTVADASGGSGGFVGLISMRSNYGGQELTIDNCYSSGDLYIYNTFTNEDYGGFIGRVTGNRGLSGNKNIVTIQDCYSFGNIYVTGRTRYGGGFAGLLTCSGADYMDLIIEDCCSTVDIYFEEGYKSEYWGGFASYIWHDSSETDQDVTIARCYATGSIYGSGEDTLFCGAGFVYGFSGNMTDCFAVGDVYSWTDPSAFMVTTLNEAGTTITNCYGSGVVRQYADGVFYFTEYPQGFLASSYGANPPTLIACFWDISETGATQSDGGGVGLADMSSSEGLTTMAFAGFDFSDTGDWTVTTNYNYGNPYLKHGVCGLESQQASNVIPSDYEAPSEAIEGRFNTPGVGFPVHWFGCEDYDYSALPVYDSFNQVSTELGIPVENLYLLGILGIAFGVFLLTVMYVRSALLGSVGFNLVLVFGAMMCILPLWIPFSAGVVQAGILYMYKQVAY